MTETIEEIVKTQDITQVGTFLFTRLLTEASKLNKCYGEAHEIWDRYYSIQPSYNQYRGQDYLEKMREKYILTYKLTLEELQKNEKDKTDMPNMQ